jgi:hypothetical protein
MLLRFCGLSGTNSKNPGRTVTDPPPLLIFNRNSGTYSYKVKVHTPQFCRLVTLNILTTAFRTPYGTFYVNK